MCSQKMNPGHIRYCHKVTKWRLIKCLNSAKDSAALSSMIFIALNKVISTYVQFGYLILLPECGQIQKNYVEKHT